MEKAILYRVTAGKKSEELAQAYMEKWVLPVDADAEIKRDDTTKGESWVVLGTRKIARKPQIVTPRQR
jgi:hypothetical protein